jgi:mono/diheme cytochrome c family protein
LPVSPLPENLEGMLMLRIALSLLLVGFAGGVALAADEAQPPASEGAPAAQAPAPNAEAAAGGGTPLETARQAEKGSLKSPYEDFASVADEGHKKFMAAGCNGCHGGTGGGGMGPPLTNQVWVYGKDGDTLFRLIALGSDELQKDGYQRKGSENVVGPMPPFGGIVKSNDDVWKIIAWIRSVNPSSAEGSSASAAE